MKLTAGMIVLVADGAKMLLLKNEGDAIDPELAVMAHRTIDNPSNRDQVTDAPGVTFSSMGHRRSTYGEGDPHQQAEDIFTAGSAATLAQAVQEHGGKVVVVAPPATLSVLRRHYDRTTQDRLVAEIDKDLTGHPVGDIARLVSEWE